MIPGVRLLIRLVITAAILGGLFIGGNVWVTGQAESRIADAIEKNFEISDVDVDIADFPLLVHIFSGTIEKVSISSDGATVGGLELDRLRVVLEDIEVEGGLLGSGNLSVKVGTGTMSSTTTQDGINAYLRERKERATVNLRENAVTVRATRTIAGASRRIVATGRFVLNRSTQTLRFVPSRVTVDGRTPSPAIEAQAKREATIEVKLPRLPGDIKADKVTVAPTGATVSAAFEDEEISITG